MMLVVPADHVVTGQRDFETAVQLACQLAEDGYLVTFGIRPIRPEIGYGYIKPNDKVVLGKRGKLRGFSVHKFVEKPNIAKATQYLKAGNYYWNSGMFIWRAATILEEIRRHQPAIARAMDQIGELRVSQASKSAGEDLYRAIKPVSIDNGVMERSSKAAVIPVAFKWS